ncbi:MAG: T9SS type A sorting domain-containing protein [Bacteroidales bacterium]|nr:T9SS type A sorting domain-containing protein [Bacteroidales bacterium]
MKNTEKKTIIRITEVLIIFMTFFSSARPQVLDPEIVVHPGINVEVGDEVYFSAENTTYPADTALLRMARYEWDFGDGYSFQFGKPNANSCYSGLAVVHYFMAPGTYNVKLTVSIYDHYDGEGIPTAPPLAKDSSVTVINVTGTAPLAGFELQHAPFHNRLAQYIYAIIPAAYQNNQSTLRVSLSGPGESNTILFTKDNLEGEEVFLLDQKTLAQGDYVIIAELFNDAGQLVPGGIWREKFSKRYPGLPKVGIDENNSMYLDGQLFFPIMPFMTNNERVQEFIDSGGINALHTEGWYASHNAGTWTDYLNKAAEKNLICAGPNRGNYSWGELGIYRQRFNHDVKIMTEYILSNHDHPAMMMWSWDDEPNMGGRNQKVDLPVLAAWQYITHEYDTCHLYYNGFYMYDWSRYYGEGLRTHDYLQSHALFGGKKWISDVIGGDIYPMNYRLSAHLNFADMGPYAAYLDALDRMQTNNKNLVPCLPVLQPCEETNGDATPPVTSGQVYLEAWLNVIHGAKGIIWFPYFVYSTVQWQSMKKFAGQMGRLAPIVLGPKTERTVADNANTALNRVDVMIRENKNYIYLFAARVTEPDQIAGAYYPGVEPDSIVVNFNISDIDYNGMIKVIDEDRLIPSVNGQFEDVFLKDDVHIYQVTIPLGYTGIETDNKLMVYPNPFTTEVTISYYLGSRSDLHIDIFDIYGRLVEKVYRCDVPAGQGSIRINTGGYPAGIYICRIETDGIIYVRKLMKDIIQ